jgi:hypothetical protein
MMESALKAAAHRNQIAIDQALACLIGVDRLVR